MSAPGVAHVRRLPPACPARSGLACIDTDAGDLDADAVIEPGTCAYCGEPIARPVTCHWWEGGISDVPVLARELAALAAEWHRLTGAHFEWHAVACQPDGLVTWHGSTDHAPEHID